MDFDFAIAALISLLAFLVPHYQALHAALCKAVEEWLRAGGARKEVICGGVVAAMAAAWLLRSRKCALYALLCLLTLNAGAIMLSSPCSFPRASFPFTLVLLLALVALLFSASKLLFRPQPNQYTYICPSCRQTNGVFTNPCASCGAPRPPSTSQN